MEFERRKGQLQLPTSLEFVLPELIVPEGLEGRLKDAQPIGTARFYLNIFDAAKVELNTDQKHRALVATGIQSQNNFLHSVYKYLGEKRFALSNWTWHEGYSYSFVPYYLEGTLLKLPE